MFRVLDGWFGGIAGCAQYNTLSFWIIWTFQSWMTIAEEAKEIYGKEESHSDVTRGHRLGKNNIVSVIIRSAISFSVISTVAISCRLLRLKIAFHTKFIYFILWADVIFRITSSIHGRRLFSVTLVRTYHSLNAERVTNAIDDFQTMPNNCNTIGISLLQTSFVHDSSSSSPSRWRRNPFGNSVPGFRATHFVFTIK